MNGHSKYASLPCSPPSAVHAADNGHPKFSSVPCSPPGAVIQVARPRRSLELTLTNTKETNAWEGLAIGAVTLARTVSTGSHRLCTSGDKCRSRNGGSSRGGLPGAVRRAFSLRSSHAAKGKGDGYYWRIHDMDGDSDHGDDSHTGEKRHDEKEEERNTKGQPEEGQVKNGEANGSIKKKKRGNNFVKKAWRKLLRK